ncbi:MAG: flagellar basal body P-ring formation protein FlgA [Alphaproteobacteria bacterium]|nr:flagellar basal body P-ring formation protein FlgA [Alphaproteobacteria bacterium]
MIRLFYRSLFLILTWAITTQSAFALAEVKSSVTVTKSVITLGDLLENLDRGNDIRVMDSPPPGQKISISTSYLVDLTRQHHVYWQNSRNIHHITVTRKGQAIRFEELRPLIEQELASRKLVDKHSALFFNRRNAMLYLPEHSSIDDITLKKLTFNPKSKRFSAVVAIPDGNGTQTTAVLRGRTEAISYLPALNKILAPGRTITAQDIVWIAVPSQRISRNIIRRKSQMIGLTPRRQLRRSTALRPSDLERPRIITRGQRVSIIFRSGRLSLTAIGKATENGARGDLIRVINSKSHKTIEATVINPEQVQVMTAENNLTQINSMAQLSQPR